MSGPDVDRKIAAWTTSAEGFDVPEIGVTQGMVGDTLVCGPDPEKHVKAIPLLVARVTIRPRRRRH